MRLMNILGVFRVLQQSHHTHDVTHRVSKLVARDMYEVHFEFVGGGQFFMRSLDLIGHIVEVVGPIVSLSMLRRPTGPIASASQTKSTSECDTMFFCHSVYL